VKRALRADLVAAAGGCAALTALRAASPRRKMKGFFTLR
jgi:hypothetical protein